MTGVKFPGKEVKAVSKLGFTAIAFKLNAIIKSQVFFFSKHIFTLELKNYTIPGNQGPSKCDLLITDKYLDGI